MRPLAQAEVLHIVRDRTTLTQVLVVPVIQLLILGNAATFRVTDSPTYVVDHDRTSTSRGLVSRFAASGQFRIVGHSESADLANAAMLRGEVTLIMNIPADTHPYILCFFFFFRFYQLILRFP